VQDWWLTAIMKLEVLGTGEYKREAKSSQCTYPKIYDTIKIDASKRPSGF